jgi:rhodanese-related sulfurtransferase
VTSLFSRLFGHRAAQPAWIEVAELQRRLASDSVLLVDVRQPEEFIAPPGHLPGAINVPLDTLAGRTVELAARRQSIVLVCKTDRRSARAAAELLAAGVSNVAVLRGGTREVWRWNRGALPGAGWRKYTGATSTSLEARTHVPIGCR